MSGLKFDPFSAAGSIAYAGAPAAAGPATSAGGNGGGTQVIQLVVDRKILAEVVRKELGRGQHRNNVAAF